VATYRIGPDDFFTGGDLRADAYTLNSMVQAVEQVVGDVPAHDPRLSEDLFTAWAMFTAQWNPSFAADWDNAGSASTFLLALNDGNRDQLIQFESRFADIYSKLKAAGIESSYVNVELSTGAPDTAKRLVEHFQSVAKSLGLGSLGWVAGMLVLAMVGLVVYHFAVRAV
jgi:hypothetical protein